MRLAPSLASSIAATLFRQESAATGWVGLADRAGWGYRDDVVSTVRPFGLILRCRSEAL